MSENPHERLKAAIETRRTELGLSLREVAEGADITTETLRAIRNGQNPSTLTKRGIERALQWTAGSIDRILDGGEPGRVVTGKATADLGGLTAHARGEARRPPAEDREEDPLDRLDRLYEEWRQEPDEREAEALSVFFESLRDRKTG